MTDPLLIVDSFDHYTTGQGTRKWTVTSGNIVPGRNGNGLNGSVTKTFVNGLSQVTMGMAFKPDTFMLTVGGTLFHMYNAAVQASNLFVASVGDGRFRYTFQGTTLLDIIPFVFNADQWYYVENSVTIVPIDSGHIRINYVFRINGSNTFTGSFVINVFSDFAADPYFHSIALSVDNNSILDDVYVINSELLGDVRIICLFARLDGTVIQWSPVGASPNFACVNEHIPDDDTTYVECASANVGFKDQYFLDMIIGFVGTIKGAQFLWCVKKSDAGVGTITASLKNSASEIPVSFIDGASTFYPSDASYIYAIAPYRKSVFTGLDWTPTEINATQQGHIRSS